MRHSSNAWIGVRTRLWQARCRNSEQPAPAAHTAVTARIPSVRMTTATSRRLALDREFPSPVVIGRQAGGRLTIVREERVTPTMTPRRRRWLRRLLFVLILAGAAYFARQPLLRGL